MQVPGARARLGGLRFHPGVGVGGGERAEAPARGRNPREGHGAERGVRGVEAAGAGEEAEQRRVGERGAAMAVVVGTVPGEERDREVRVGVPERGDGGGEARVGERGREERREGAGPGRVGGARGEHARERRREGGGDGRARSRAVREERGDAGHEPR